MEVVEVRYIGSDDQYQTYAPSDVALINVNTIIGNYGAPNDYIEYFIKDLSNTVLSANYYATQYQLDNSVVDPVTRTTTQLYLDPETDARNLGYNRGIVNVKYNFFAKQLASAPATSTNFWIKEISTSRTEIKAARQDLSNTALSEAFGAFNAILSADAYYPTFYLNFGSDVQLIGINAVYVEEEGIGYVIFKLYEPLPTQFDLKSTFWVVTQVAEPAEFNVTINVAAETVIDSIPIQGPNFKVTVKDKVGQTTPYYSYESLLLTSVTSSYQQLQSLMQEKGIKINVDYSDFNNFIHFSSATERLYNFVYKVQLIESASAGLAQNNTSTAKVLLQNQIDTTITNFDGYEYYLYFTSASTAWPKQDSTQPYLLYSVTSSQVVNWLGGVEIMPSAATMSMYRSASYYDDQNKDLLIYVTPSYIAEDSANAPYLVFLNMIGQHFDNIWIYLKDVTNHYSAENNPFVGVSMDQVANALRSFGIQLYTNTSITDNIYYSMLGLNQTGSALPVTSSLYSTVNIASSSLYPLAGEPYLSASLSLPPFGEEKINRYVTTFVTQSSPAFNISQSFATLPASQIQGETYKRLYHNLAYLLKTRGTERGVKALITTFGIPTDILTPHEYGGYNIYQVPGIQEISNTRIITGSVLNISSSLLSPYTTIQYYQNDQDKTSNDLQIGFSPADSINASITSSGYVTSSTQPGYFNIMQLIGAPDLQYSSSYTPLVNLANTYFDAEYTSRYNVWDFIRVIKYYNNSVFKMLRDWVPARSSASTGIVIQSHMLERNKYPRNEPTFTNISGSAQIKLVSVSGSDGGSIQGNTYYVEAIPVQYQSNSVYLGNSPGTIYISSSNNIQKYTGEFSGSTIDTYSNTFTQEEISSYAYPWTSSVAPSIVGGNIIYSTYSLSPTLNNITGAVLSQRFLDLDYNGAQLVPVNYGLITQSIDRTQVIGSVSQSMAAYSQYAQLQDYNYFLPSTVRIRYSGSYLQGAQYNTWSVGDISYGNQPVINYYSNKLGLFTQIQSSSFIPGTVNASLGYLADVSGGLFELNQNNKHWTDVQNIFVQGTQLTVKQFDNKKYSNQVATDGIKTIYNSGYNYTPELYFDTASDPRIYFQFIGTAASSTLSVQNQTNFFISGAASPRYPMKVASSTGIGKATGFIYNIFDDEVTDTSGYYTIGDATLNKFPTYSVPYAGIRTFNTDFSIAVAFTSSNQQVTYNYTVAQNSNPINTVTQTFTSTQTLGNDGTITVRSTTLSVINPTGPIYYFAAGNYELYDYLDPVRIGAFTLGTNQAGYQFVSLYDDALGQIVGTAWSITYDPDGFFDGYMDSNDYWLYPAGFTYTPPVPPTDNLSTTLNISSTVEINTATSDKITFQLEEVLNGTSENYTASVSVGSLTVVESTAAQGVYAYASTASSPYIVDFNNQGNLGQITMSVDLSNFYQNYQQIPYFTSGSVTYSSSLYNQYGDINTPFDPQPYDKIILQDRNGVIQDLDIFTASFYTASNGAPKQLVFQTFPSILTSWEDNTALVQKFLLLRRYEDEQNVIVTFTKPNGQTSYGFILPDTINPVVPANINTLQANVQAQLLSTQTATSNS